MDLGWNLGSRFQFRQGSHPSVRTGRIPAVQGGFGLPIAPAVSETQAARDRSIGLLNWSHRGTWIAHRLYNRGGRSRSARERSHPAEWVYLCLPVTSLENCRGL